MRVLKVTSSHPCFIAPCLSRSCLRTFLHHLLLLHLVRLPLTPSLLYPSTITYTAPLQGRLCFGRLAEQPVSQVMSPSLSSKSAAKHTPINLPSSKSSLDTNLDDLATTVDASEICNTTSVGRLSSPLFCQERDVNVFPFSVSCSQTHSSVGETHAGR